MIRKEKLWLDDMNLSNEEKIFLLEFLKGNDSWNADEIDEEISIVEDRIFEEEILLGGEDD